MKIFKRIFKSWLFWGLIALSVMIINILLSIFCDWNSNIFTAISGWISGIATVILGGIALWQNIKYDERRKIDVIVQERKDFVEKVLSFSIDIGTQEEIARWDMYCAELQNICSQTIASEVFRALNAINLLNRIEQINIESRLFSKHTRYYFVLWDKFYYPHKAVVLENYYHYSEKFTALQKKISDRIKWSDIFNKKAVFDNDEHKIQLNELYCLANEFMNSCLTYVKEIKIQISNLDNSNYKKLQKEIEKSFLQETEARKTYIYLKK